jgi:dTDP-4-dehydrorhamnose reductase
MTKSPSKPTSFEDESDNRFPRARVLIVGEDTSLAAAFFETDASGGQQRIVLPSSVNLADDREIFEAIRMRRPDFVVNCMVESGVDRAELDPTECRQINHDLPVSLAIACREFDATLIQLSTDYIFDGQKDIAYFEDDAPNPLNLYGQTRLEAERDIESLLDRHIILRVSHLFAPGPNSFVTNILDRARIESELPMIQDERGCPTSIFDIGRVVSAVIDQLHAGAGAYGVYHVGCQGDASWIELGECIIAQARQFEELAVEEIIGVSGQSIQGRAERPRRLVLSTRKLLYTFGIKPRPWRHELAETVERHYAQEGAKHAEV